MEDFRYCAIRVAGTDKYIPPIPGSTKRGGSALEPREGRPRLFNNAHCAARSLTQWRKGRHKEHKYSGEYETEIEPRPERLSMEMEIVEFSITLTKVLPT